LTPVTHPLLTELSFELFFLSANHEIHEEDVQSSQHNPLGDPRKQPVKGEEPSKGTRVICLATIPSGAAGETPFPLDFHIPLDLLWKGKRGRGREKDCRPPDLGPP
jgi:hypothetical protein